MTYEEVIQVEKQLAIVTRKRGTLKERLLRIQGTDMSMEFRLEEEILEADNFHYEENETPNR